VDETSNAFVQNSSVNDKVDMLFVIDNSGSMAEEQAALADNFETFITEFSSRDLDFRIGIIATDNRDTPAWWAGAPYAGILNDGAGSLLSKYASYRWLSPETPSLVDKFKDNIQLGTSGSGYEMPITALNTAITTKAATGEWNENFFRSSAYLAAIIVTDEDESVSTADASYVIDSNATTAASRITTLKSNLNTLKGSSSDYSVYTIAAESLAICPAALGKGELVKAAAEELGGEFGSICDDFADTLVAIGDNILTALTRFSLAQPPEGDITVTVNGSLVAQDTTHTNGWDYLPATQEIEFYGAAVPPSGAVIDVDYVPAAPLD